MNRKRRATIRELEKFAAGLAAIESGMYPSRLKKAVRQAQLERVFGRKFK